jgi:hypothetical protein
MFAPRESLFEEEDTVVLRRRRIHYTAIMLAAREALFGPYQLHCARVLPVSHHHT